LSWGRALGPLRGLSTGQLNCCLPHMEEKRREREEMADGRHFENRSLYLSEKSSDFNEIWYSTSDIEPGYSHVTKN